MNQAMLFELLGVHGGVSFSADLHVHSTVSDGSETAEQLVSRAAGAGITHLAFTNHDITRGIAAAQRAGRAVGVTVVGGIEVSAYDFRRGRKVHILGLGLHEGSPAVERLCRPLLQRRDENSRWQLSRLLEAGYRIDVERVEHLAAASTCLYKQHIMAGLVDEPCTSPAWQRLYRRLFKGEGIASRDIAYVDARDAVEAIVRDGGCAVLAHPGQTKSYELVPELVEAGLTGIERLHPDHSEADHDRCFNLAQRFGLFCTGGSDYHGIFGRSPSLGCCRIEGSVPWND